VYGTTDFDGNLTHAGVWGQKFWWFHNNWTANVSGAIFPEVVDPRRSRGGPLMLRAPGHDLYAFFDTDGSRKRYYNAEYEHTIQPGENSFSYAIRPYFVYKPVSNLRFEIGPGYESLRDGHFFVRAIDDPSAAATYGTRYVFARLDQQILSANIRLNVSFTPTMSLQFYGQPLIATGRYSDLEELAQPKSLDFVPQGSGSWTYDPVTREFDADGPGGDVPELLDFNFRSIRGNAVFRWEYMPGSAFFFVWTQERTDSVEMADFQPGRSLNAVLNAEADNIFLVKLTYYLTR
jgi:hypothetical protein